MPGPPLTGQLRRQDQIRQGAIGCTPAKISQNQAAIGQPQWLQHTLARHAVQQAVGQQDG
jgi:hypothetical protein